MSVLGTAVTEHDSRRRSGDRLKLKCEGGQEFVIGGFTDPVGARVGFGALLGYPENGRLRYAGEVGTAYDTRTLVVREHPQGGGK